MRVDAFTPRDDHDHFEDMTDRWWSTETAWFSFHNRERGLLCHVYALFRPVIGTAVGGIWVNDRHGFTPWDVPYFRYYTSQRIPGGMDLAHAQLRNGVSIETLRPTQAYAIRFDDPGELTVAVDFTALMPAFGFRCGESTLNGTSHFDQFGRALGHIDLHGERIAIDCVTARDRSWGPRPERRKGASSYSYGVTDSGDGFVCITQGVGEENRLVYGFLRRDGEVQPLVSGTRVVESRHAQEGFVERAVIRASDAQERHFTAEGTTISRHVLCQHDGVVWDALVAWHLNGEEAMGEDHDIWPIRAWSRLKRRGEL
jgi:hypothetical protein